ncbi:NAD(P)/FAD-dependent oxidoreductase [Halovivax gelatinilyticus]|uniref:NAD(P)/FAD-dependent oxidoreductase n=1 Tax=Halovivax gelatinilyticus TaxID=2961597 RepID=UPI0020CA4EC5|nr:NAD(P)/FAD-dependent oxidoreductase [Halovivax gelatinilyticus]
MPSVVIVGAGLAGLSAARQLATAGFSVEVLERRESVGGRVRTRIVDGFTLDRGFQVFFTGYPAARSALEYDALDLRTFTPGAVIARPGHRSILSDPRRDPAGVVASVRNPAVSPADFLRTIHLWRHLRGTSPREIFPGPDQSVETYLVDRGFSRSFIDAFFRPFYGGITLDRSLSTAASVFEYTAKMVLDGDIAVPARGMVAIPTQLAESARAAGATISTDTLVQSVEASRADDSGGVTVEFGGTSIAADAAIVATDPPTARALTGVASIPTTGRGCVTQYYSLPAAIDLETGGRLLLNATDDGPNQIAPVTSVAPEYAPAGRQLLAATYLGDVPADDEALTSHTRRTLASWYPGEDFEALTAIHTDRIEFAQFAQPPGTHVALPDPDAPAGPIYLAGDFTRWSSIQGALESGQVAADTVIDALGG